MSAKINDGGPAFPVRWDDMVDSNSHHGMPLRDWFAGQALPQVFCAFSKDCQAELEQTAGSNLDTVNAGCSLTSWMTDMRDSEWAGGIANACYNIADAMIAARKGGER